MFLIRKLVLPNGKIATFDWDGNEPLVLSGPNGSGKSLFLKSLAWLYPLPYERFEVSGTDVRALSPFQYRRNVMYLAHQLYGDGEQTAEEFLKAPLRLEAYRNFVPKFDLGPYLDRWGLRGQSLKLLSSGQKQLLSLLRAFLLDPKVLLLDEPTANLDTQRTLEVEQLLRDWRNQAHSYLMVSHGPEQGQRLGLRKCRIEDILVT